MYILPASPEELADKSQPNRHQTPAATGSFDYEAALTGYRGDILVVDVSDDVLAPRTATDALLAKVPRAHVTRYAYDSARGAAKPGSHFTWVRDRGGLAPAIADWARSRSL